MEMQKKKSNMAGQHQRVPEIVQDYGTHGITPKWGGGHMDTHVGPFLHDGGLYYVIR